MFSIAPVLRTVNRNVKTITIGTTAKAAATGGLRLMFEAIIVPMSWVDPPTNFAAR